MNDAPTATGPRHPHDGAGRRLVSLDLLRGLTVLGMIIVNSTAGVQKRDGPVFPLLLHADWAGFTLADSIFPAFILMVGVSVAISSRGTAPETKRILLRAGRLILLGLLLSNMFWLYASAKYHPRLPGVLQRIGIVYAVAALLYPITTPRMRGLIAGALLLLYWPLCLIPSPDGLPTDIWVQGHNFVSWADRAMLGTLRFVKGPDGYDPEGLLSTLPTIAEALIGTLVGDYLRRALPPIDAAKRMALAAGAMIAGGLLWGLVFPIAKNLWTSSFVLLTSGIALLLLAGFHARFDRRDASLAKGGLLGSFGRNAIAAYALHEVASILLLADALQWPFRQLAPVTGTQIAALAPVLLFTALVWWPIASMDRRGWYLKI
jgi:predicted acyltransferase